MAKKRKKLIVKGKVGRVGMPTCNRWYTSTIMMREIKKTRIKIRERWKRGLTVQNPLDVSVFRPQTTFEHPIPMVEKHDNEMLALAETIATPEEVIAILKPLAKDALIDAISNHCPIRLARHNIIGRMERYLDAHYFVGFKRKLAVAKIAKRLLKGYQKKWSRVNREIRLLIARAEKHGDCYSNYEIRVDAIMKVHGEEI